MKHTEMLSIVVPAYKQEKTIEKDITHLDKVISLLKIPYEIIIIVDGALDKTHKKIKKIKTSHIKIFAFKKNYGKGNAVKYGMVRAKGDIIGFIDAGMDLDPSELVNMLAIMKKKNADIVVGSKLHPDSKVTYPFARKILSWGYRTVTHMLFGFSIRDTQVGIKLFKRKVAMDVFPKIVVKRFAFDVEVLAVAHRLGYRRIYEAPIHLDFQGVSSINSRNFWSVIYSMLWDTAAVFYRLNILHYYDRKK